MTWLAGGWCVLLGELEIASLLYVPFLREIAPEQSSKR
jgi:hypothetical protein